MFAVNKHLSLNLSSSSLMCKKRFLLSMRENMREKRSKIELSYQASIWLAKEVDKITKIKEGECLVLICLRVIIKCNWSAGLSWLIRCYNYSWMFLDKTSSISRLERARLIYFSKELIFFQGTGWKIFSTEIESTPPLYYLLDKKMVGSQVENRGDIHKRREIDWNAG